MNARSHDSEAAGPHFRQFRPDDAGFCYETRRSAYRHEFIGELSDQETAAAMNAYTPADYVKMAEIMPFFIAETHTNRIGFFTLKRLNTHTAEIPLMYITRDNIRAGVGSACIAYIEAWIEKHWSEVTALIVDTIIPKYNSGFYKKVGFTPEKQVFCEFKGLSVRALRLIKTLKNI